MTENPPRASEKNPFGLFQTWFAEAKSSEPEDADAACIATVDEWGMPNARMVLMRKVDERGFVFFTNYESRKGQELINHPKAAICYHWKSLQRQVRIQGKVEKVSEAEADAYFNSRPRNSRIGAWASIQSQPLPARQDLLDRVAEFEKKFDGVENPPRPEYWSGFRIVPERIEFWQQTEFRLHERQVYTLQNGVWSNQLLYP